ncbi:hypothetical protein Tco_1206880 [Tanacetum coccineum]
MCMYLKNQGGYKQSHFKGMSYEDIRPIFERVWDQNQSFVPKDSEIEKEVIKRSEFDFQEPSAKRQKIREVSGPVEEQFAAKEKEVSEELKKLLVIVPVEEVYIEALQVYQVFEDMLKRFDKDDLEKLYDLVKKKFSSTEPTINKEKVLWVELKRLFKPDDDDTLWKLHIYMHDPLKWRLYDTCGVHHVSIERGHDIFMLVEKDYPLTRALMIVMLVNKLQMDKSLEMANELLRKIFYQVNHKFRGGLLGIKIITTSTNCEKIEAGTITTNLTARLPILNPADYDFWLMRIEQYFLMTDYSLWEVIKNGNKVIKRTIGIVEQEYEPTTTEEKQDRRSGKSD